MTCIIIPIFGADIHDLADMMIEKHGSGAEAEVDRRAALCQSRRDQVGCEAWWRVAASIRDVGVKPAGPVN